MENTDCMNCGRPQTALTVDWFNGKKFLLCVACFNIKVKNYIKSVFSKN